MTWLFGAIAAWAVACTMIALSGFGGGYSLLPDDRALIKDPGKIQSGAARSSMGPLESYAEAYNHPLFYPDRKPMAVHVSGAGTATEKALDVALTSIIITPTLKMAIVEDPKTKESYRVREGQPIGGSYGGWKLTGIAKRSATFDGGSQGQNTIDLRIFDGKGGEEPTRMGLTPQVVASGALGPPRTVVSVGDQDANQPPANATPAPPEATPPPDAGTAPNDVAARAAAEAAQQAEQIRRRIEERRRQAQLQRDASTNKD